MSNVYNILKQYQRRKEEKYAIFLDNEPVFITTKNIYKSPRIAKKQIADKCGGRYDKQKREEIKLEIESLIEQGSLEIRKV
jgi:hypothetical protein